ncbi:conserved unknown protein [Ectocarpus siliculosus]|uniref:Uncharacterized protein n=1 Tax=Ectocarpus siliculosus TaxID=2880 RepID=D7FR72_ECTSI|nr:conserved unknown protein [Ectocarpus siliculosus]|eukprot:CBJ49197.1 conserved unknown protein [Ectocarpus siliculosus]
MSSWQSGRSSYRALSVLAVTPSKAGASTGSRGGASDVSGSGGASAGGGGGKRRRVVLIEELPEVYGEEKKARLRSLMAECARSSPSPVIICWSQASESASYQSRLEQVLSRETLRMPGVQITTCNPINATLLRQHLKGVLALEGVSDPKGTLVQSAITTCAGLCRDRASCRTLLSGPTGDIRHALLNLQMSVGGRGGSGSTAAAAAVGRSNGGRGRAKRSGAAADAVAAVGGVGGRKKRGAGVSKSCAAAGGTGQRDTFLTQFHALGKLLYAKRVPPDSDGAGGWPTAGGGGGDGGGEGRGPLAFVPEDVLSQGGMELDWALAFLQYHCVDFYTDESELSQGLGYFSDADMFASRMFDSSRGYDGGGEQAVFPQRYAESIASRATAVSNRHPAKSRMRAFGAPKSFEMRRSRKEASGALRRFVGDAWDASGGDADALWASSRHLKEAVDTDLLPTARLITGEWEAEAALRSLLQRFMQDREQQQEGQQQDRTWATGTESAAAAAMHTDGGRLSLPAGGAAPASPPPLSWVKGAAAGGGGERGTAKGGGARRGGGVGGHGSTAAVSYGEGEEEDLDEIGDF